MKLIRWVEVHIGRSKRKTKKDKDGVDGKLTLHCGADIPRRRDDSTPCTPLRKVEPLGRDLPPQPRSAGSTPRRAKHPPSPHPSLRAPDTPGSRAGRRSLQIRTSFLDPGLAPLSAAGAPAPAGAPVASFGSSTALDSPRVRCRIRTNPWLPSPRCSGGSAAECGWTPPPGVRSSSIGSESTESIAGSGFGGQSSGSLWEGYCGEPWSTFRSPSVKRLPRVTLHQKAGGGRGPVSDDPEDRPYCPAAFCRPIPRSAWMDFRDLSPDVVEMRLEDATTTTAAEIARDDAGESSDEAYSEDYVHSEDHDDLPLEVIRASEGRPPDTGSPQADSACGSDRDNSSCSTTPLSETPASSKQSGSKALLQEPQEPLQDKVQRLRIERHLVDQRMQEARAEEIIRREERLLLQRELVQFRRLLLLQTLSELRDQLERQGDRRRGGSKAYEEAMEGGLLAQVEGDEEAWLQVHAELVG